ncbi:hypothetical protein GCM10025778_32280 [Paeniglutamicibacter antarcticus]|uniref:Uncharacterized protein n=2 Tax=Paeniglutamicibacter antarcticus TaxID=494023 RepID=A0ABP9TPL8_9MICC
MEAAEEVLGIHVAVCGEITNGPLDGLDNGVQAISFGKDLLSLQTLGGDLVAVTSEHLSDFGQTDSHPSQQKDALEPE